MSATLIITALALAPAASAGTVWKLDVRHGPEHMAPGQPGQYVIFVSNTGDTASSGACPGPDCVSVVDTLPSGVVATDSGFLDGTDFFGNTWDCSGTTTVTCTLDGANSLQPTGPFFFQSGEAPPIFIAVSVPPDASGTLDNEVTISGGGASPVAVREPTVFSSTDAGFGIRPGSFSADAFDSSGDGANPVRQAGAHPAELRTDFDLNMRYTSDPHRGGNFVEPDGQMRDVTVRLPRGMIGDPQATPQCPHSLFQQGLFAIGTMCPADSQIGLASVLVNNGNTITPGFDRLPMYNMVPPPGAVAAFAFTFDGLPVWITASLDPSDYSILATVHDSPTLAPVTEVRTRLWGVPSDPSHDALRFNPNNGPFTFPASSSTTPKPFLTMPSQCDSADSLSVSINSWETPVSTSSAQSPPLQMTGCEEQSFFASATIAASTEAPDAPTGLSFDMTVPQDDSPTGLGTPPVKKVTVTLPEGMTVSPSSANGLAACSPAQIGLGTNDPVACPQASKIGTATLNTPLLADPVEGAVYLASQNDNPFKTTVALYLVLEDHERGLLVKLPGRVDLDPDTGRVTTTFDDNPQFPFTRLRLQLKSGPRAPLTTPSTCGVHTAGTEITSWNSALSPVTALSSFAIAGDCTTGFRPAMVAGTASPVAGRYSPLTLRLTRSDDDSEMRSLSTLQLPPGLLANVASVSARCSEAQANSESCPAASHIGTVTVGAGAGPEPVFVSGDVYLMGAFANGPFKGDPFGLAVVVHAQAGPFDLGYVVVEAGIQVHDDGSITSSQTEPFPTILQGIPLQIKDIRLNLDRPDFILNPTNCSQMAFAGSVVSTEGMVAPVSSRFQVGECAALGFKPSFTVFTAGKTSKANGASLHAHIATHEGPSSADTASESNIAKVDVQLPLSLPARLTTLQKACTAAQFASNPAGCPAASFVGTATAHTPILASPLSGPAILVSHGGQAFPDLVLVLQGEGVRLNITGHTQIKKGITYSRFETVSDAPVSSFDLTLPQGAHSALTTDVPGRNLCTNTRTVTVTKRVTRRIHGHNRKVTVKAKKAVAAPLLMPTTLTAQNGAVIHQNTKIAVTACAKGKVVKHQATRKRK